MTITCPHCEFAKEVDPATLPDKPLKVTCPRCREVFSFQKPAPPAAETFTVAAEESSDPALPAPVAEPARQRSCKICGAVQPTGSFCTACGASLVGGVAIAAGYRYAGFWIRAAAVIVDSLLVTVVQGICGYLLGLAGSGLMMEDELLLGSVGFMLGSAISLAYYIFFTGYCGQTPGKMALRIKVIRSDGSDIGYGRAFLREAIGKFVSAIILFIGYLMAAFDDRKRALHDRMADTYVIKL